MEKDLKDKLIDLVKENSVLYDVNDLNYKNTVMKRSLWDKIAKKMGLSIVRCQQTWKNMKYSYLKGKNKTRKGYSRDLSFLDKFCYSKSENLKIEYEEEFLDENINYNTSLALPKTKLFNEIETENFKEENEDVFFDENINTNSLNLQETDKFNDTESVLKEDAIFHDYRKDLDDIEEFLELLSNAFRQIKSAEERERIKVEIWNIFRTTNLNKTILSNNTVDQAQNRFDNLKNQNLDIMSEEENNQSLNCVEFVKCEYFKCNLCYETFRNEQDLYDHSDVHTKTSNLNCTHCPKTFTQKDFLIRHKLMHENSEICCKICKKLFKTEERLKLHIQFDHSDAHTVKPNLICSYCSKTFKRKVCLRRHELMHENREFSCQICSKLFKKKEYLKSHMKVHTGERPHKCELCPAAFADIANLKVHRICVHTNDYNFPCTYDGCTKRFKLKSLMEKHFKYLHLRKKIYQCEECGLEFLTSSQMTLHRRRHHLDYNNRPHDCKLCGKKFILKSGLTEHLNTHTGEKPYKCNFNKCYRGFAKKSGLREHKKLHTGEKNHICQICDKAFAQTAGLSNHMKYH